MVNIKLQYGQHYEIESKIQNETRSILVSLPRGYDETNNRYPVLFILNSSWEMNFISNASTVHYSYESGNTPDMIVVGICDTAYRRDFMPHLGNSDEFLAFMEKELIPFIDEKFRTTSFRILYGQSNAGLLTTYVLLKQPEIFDAYIASSPMFGWDEEFVLKNLADFSSKKLSKDTYYYFNYGAGDFDKVKNSITNFTKKLNDIKIENFIWKMEHFETEGHVPFPSLYNALKYIFPEWKISNEEMKESDLSDLKAYYKKLSEKYRSDFIIPGSTLMDYAFQPIQEKKYDLVIDRLKYYIELYPYSASGYMRMAQIYNMKGDFEQAKKFFLKADELNPLSKVALKTLQMIENSRKAKNKV